MRTAARGRTRTVRSKPASRRPGFIYQFWGYDPRALLKGVILIVLIYVGQTRQQPETRWAQHEFGTTEDPPKIWWPLVTKKIVHERGLLWSDPELDNRELVAISAGGPLANIKLNMLNPHRIPPWEMKRLMRKIEKRGGVEALVRQARAKSHTVAGFTIDPKTNNVTWYGTEAARVGTAILEKVGTQWKSSESQSTGSLFSPDLPQVSWLASMWRSLGFGSTEREPV